MSGRYLTDLADVCRRAGLTVVENAGWQTRARSSGGYASGRPWCVMWHHTASQTSAANDVAYIVRGSSSSPLSNLYLARDGTVHVLAAGATNTNGKGGPLTFSRGTVPVDQMNTHAIGIEAANSGTGEAWPQVQVDAYFTLSNALCAAYGLQPSDIASHAEYAPGRKIDPATAAAVQGPWRPATTNSAGSWRPADMRAEALARSESAPQPEPPEEEQIVFTMFDCLGNTYGGYMDRNGIFAQVTWLSPTRMTACQSAGAAHIGELSPADLGNCDLLGPIPTGTPRDTFANVIG